MSSDVQGLAWPESPGLGLALEGLGFSNLQARPYSRAWAWLGPGLAQARALDLDYLIHILCDLDPTSKKKAHNFRYKVTSVTQKISKSGGFVTCDIQINSCLSIYMSTN